MNTAPEYIHVCCNGAKPGRRIPANSERHVLEWRDAEGDVRNIRLSLPDFVRGVYHLSDRALDLLEIAAYVYCADRLCSRGPRDALEFHAWSRRFHFHIKVRDAVFWQAQAVQKALRDMLLWMTGDQDYAFSFHSGHKTGPEDLFDHEEFTVANPAGARVALFSGGLDSLAGAVELLENTDSPVCLVSHRSQTGTTRTQQKLGEALQRAYGMRVFSYSFGCTLRATRAREESQRARAFLYSAIAYSLCEALSLTEFHVFENGVTALNLPKRADMLSARASRTAHPKTIYLLKTLLSKIADKDISIRTPYVLKAKADVFRVLADSNQLSLVNSSVSCSRTFRTGAHATHCGQCPQCIDRRLAAYAASVEQHEGGIYAFDIARDAITEPEAKTHIVDYIRQAVEFAEASVDSFVDRFIYELADATDHIGFADEQRAAEALFELCQRHGRNVLGAVRRIREEHDDLCKSPPANSLLSIVSERTYLRAPVELLAREVCARLARALPLAYQHRKPESEPDLNDKIEAYLDAHRGDMEREHPAIRFGLANSIPDHSLRQFDLLLEAKYIRAATTPSKISEGIAADLVKYPSSSLKVFVVYDPHRAIRDDAKFCEAFEQKGYCLIKIIR